MPASSSAPWPALRVTYHVTASNQPDLDARVESLLLEQTVELPRAALRDKFVLENIVGRVASIRTIGAEKHTVVIDFRLPKDWPHRERALPGPQFGTAGLRHITGVRDRPLTSTALKPIGLS